MSLSKDEGGVHSTGIVDGRSVYERLFEMSDPTDSFDIVDGKELGTDDGLRGGERLGLALGDAEG